MKVTITEISNREIDYAVQVALDLCTKRQGDVFDIANEGLIAIESRAKVNAPVDTGRLRASIHTVPIGSKTDNFSYTSNAGQSYDGGLDVVRSHGGDGIGFIGTNVQYAAAQEFGTRYHKGYQYLTRAYKEILPKLQSALLGIKK